MATRPQNHIVSVRNESEKKLGITQRASSINFSFTGEIRKRYTDFLVYEIRKDGTVVHLHDFVEEKPQVAEPQVRSSYSFGIRNGRPPHGPLQRSAHGDLLTRSPIQQSLSPTPTEVIPKPVQNTPVVQPIPDEDRIILESLVGGSADNIITFDKAIQGKEPLFGDKRQVELEPITDRDLRSKIHQEIRRIFSGRIETVASSTGVITATAARWAMNRGNRGVRGGRGANNNSAGPGRRDNRGQDLSYTQLGGDYLHFTLYKENKDSMDAINTMARLLKIKASNFGFAGTKDRRAATVQRVSVHKQRANNLNWINTRLPNVKIGDFSYHADPIQLGQHGGNEFVITIKNCHNLGDAGCSVQQRARMVQESVEFSLAYMMKHGYINYFGLQRFGTYSIGTHMLGMKLLKGDFAGAVEDILHVNDEYTREVLGGHHQPSNRDDYQRAKAISTWRLTNNADKALELMPKRFSSESAVIRHLGRNKTDSLGAILAITRGMRMMYIHAYQSYVWNFLATFRWSKYGPNVVEGDLVLADGRSDEDFMDVDLVSEGGDDDHFYAQARPLTAEDVASGKYTIFDVVLPTPGYDVIYPRNDVGDYYVSFMAKPENGGLSPYEMRRRNKEFSLSGNFRHLLGRFIGEPQYAVRLYDDDNDQMHPTDLDLCNSKKAAEKAAAPAMAKATSAHWADFTQNTAQYDEAVRVDRRRKAAELPAQGEVVMNETYVKTGLDDGAKRVKITRERQTETQMLDAAERADETTAAAQVSEVMITPAAQEWLAQLQGSERPPRSIQPFPSSATIVVNAEDVANPDGNAEPQYPGVIGQERGQEPVHDAKAKTIDINNTDGWMEIAEAKMPDLRAILSSSSSSSLTSVASKANVTIGSKDNVTDGSKDNVTARSQDNVTAGSQDTVTNGNGKQPSTDAIVVPELFSPSANPIVSMNGKIDETRPGAEKIAVVLKFQLKSSNYATVVLRELMGANATLHT